jgi:hypothetical protein
MFEMLDVAIGVAFLFLIMSLIASAVAELIEGLLRYRARDLERGIRELVRDPKLVEEIYNHPLVNGLFKGQYDPNHKGRLPSYIPSTTFVLALLDAVDTVTTAPATAAPATPAAPPASPGAIAHWFSEAKRSFYEEKPPAAADKDAVARLKKGLDTLKNSAGADLAAQRLAIETWFNGSMDRVSGWYKHRTARNLFFIGLAAAFALNVDSVKVTKQLMADKPVRDAIVASASSYVQAPQTPNSGDAKTRLDDAVGRLEKLGLKLGWNRPWCAYWCDQKVTPSDYLLKLFGLFITACAVSLGAPFWFDMLNKFIVVRSTVKPEEKSGKEASKDPKK